MRLGFHAPEKFGANLFDETNCDAVLDNLTRWPVIMVYEFADLADTRDELAAMLIAIQEAGSAVISVSQKIDLRGLDEKQQAVKDAFAIWCALAGTAPLPEAKAPAAEETAPVKVPDWTPEQQDQVYAALEGNPEITATELSRTINVHWKKVESWLKYAASTPAPDTTDAG